MGKPNRKKRRGEDYYVMGIFVRGFFSLQLFHAPKSFREEHPYPLIVGDLLQIYSGLMKKQQKGGDPRVFIIRKLATGVPALAQGFPLQSHRRRGEQRGVTPGF
jgi:hypothetical protein